MSTKQLHNLGRNVGISAYESFLRQLPPELPDSVKIPEWRWQQLMMQGISSRITIPAFASGNGVGQWVNLGSNRWRVTVRCYGADFGYMPVITPLLPRQHTSGVETPPIRSGTTPNQSQSNGTPHPNAPTNTTAQPTTADSVLPDSHSTNDREANRKSLEAFSHIIDAYISDDKGNRAGYFKNSSNMVTGLRTAGYISFIIVPKGGSQDTTPITTASNNTYAARFNGFPLRLVVKGLSLEALYKATNSAGSILTTNDAGTAGIPDMLADLGDTIGTGATIPNEWGMGYGQCILATSGGANVKVNREDVSTKISGTASDKSIVFVETPFEKFSVPAIRNVEDKANYYEDAPYPSGNANVGGTATERDPRYFSVDDPVTWGKILRNLSRSGVNAIDKGLFPDPSHSAYVSGRNAPVTRYSTVLINPSTGNITGVRGSTSPSPLTMQGTVQSNGTGLTSDGGVVFAEDGESRDFNIEFGRVMEADKDVFLTLDVPSAMHMVSTLSRTENTNGCTTMHLVRIRGSEKRTFTSLQGAYNDSEEYDWSSNNPNPTFKTFNPANTDSDFATMARLAVSFSDVSESLTERISGSFRLKIPYGTGDNQVQNGDRLAIRCVNWGSTTSPSRITPTGVGAGGHSSSFGPRWGLPRIPETGSGNVFVFRVRDTVNAIYPLDFRQYIAAWDVDYDPVTQTVRTYNAANRTGHKFPENTSIAVTQKRLANIVVGNDTPDDDTWGESDSLYVILKKTWGQILKFGEKSFRTDDGDVMLPSRLPTTDTSYRALTSAEEANRKLDNNSTNNEVVIPVAIKDKAVTPNKILPHNRNNSPASSGDMLMRSLNKASNNDRNSEWGKLTNDMIPPGEITRDKLDEGWEFHCTKGEQQITLSAGKYLMECWGAEGGGDRSDRSGLDGRNQGGMGMYKSAEVRLSAPCTFYIGVGEKPSNNGVGGFPQGGDAGDGSRHATLNLPRGYGGGGCSYVRVYPCRDVSSITRIGGTFVKDEKNIGDAVGQNYSYPIGDSTNASTVTLELEYTPASHLNRSGWNHFSSRCIIQSITRNNSLVDLSASGLRYEVSAYDTETGVTRILQSEATVPTTEPSNLPAVGSNIDWKYSIGHLLRKSNGSDFTTEELAGTTAVRVLIKNIPNGSSGTFQIRCTRNSTSHSTDLGGVSGDLMIFKIVARTQNIIEDFKPFQLFYNPNSPISGKGEPILCAGGGGGASMITNGRPTNLTSTDHEGNTTNADSYGAGGHSLSSDWGGGGSGNLGGAGAVNINAGGNAGRSSIDTDATRQNGYITGSNPISSITDPGLSKPRNYGHGKVIITKKLT